MSETLADNILIQQYLKGDEKSLEILFERYLKPIYGFVYRSIGGQIEAEDVTQEVFIKVWKNLKKFDQEKKFKPWIFQIAKNTSIDFLRKKKSIPFSRFENENGQNALVENITTKPINILENFSDKKFLATATQGLKNKEKRTVEMRHYDGLSFKEMARVFNESINTVKSRYRRALINLRDVIKKQ